MISTSTEATEKDKPLNKTDLDDLPHPKIRPIRKYKVQLSHSNMQKQVVKNIDSKTWEYNSSCNGNQKAELKKLFHMIKASKTCQKLSFGLGGSQNISNRDMRFVSKGLKGLVSLESLCIILYMSSRFTVTVTDQGLGTLSQSLKGLSSLKRLDLRLFEVPQATDRSAKSLGQVLKSLTSLKEVVLNINRTRNGSWEGLAMGYLNEGLKRLKFIEDFSLDLDCLKRVNDNNIQSLMLYLQRFSRLTNLKLILTQLTAKGFEIFTECLGRLGSLNALSVDLTTSPIGDQEIGNLGEALKKLEKLSDIHFNLSESISDNGLRVFSQSLQQMTCLNRLSLSCEQNDLITSETLHYIAQLLSKISHLELKFSNCKSILNPGVQNLVNGFKNASSLQSLSLDLTSCRRLNDNVLEAIADGLHDLVALKSLILTLNNQNLTATGFKNLCKSFERLISLKDLKLNMPTHFGDADLKQISEVLTGCCAFQNFYLDFSACKKITDEGLRSLTESLKGVERLQSLFVSFYRCERINNDEMERLARTLRGITGLQSRVIKMKTRVIRYEMSDNDYIEI